MRLLRHLLRVVAGTLRFALASRSPALLIAVAVGLVMVAVALAATAVAPVALYPFI